MLVCPLTLGELRKWMTEEYGVPLCRQRLLWCHHPPICQGLTKGLLPQLRADHGLLPRIVRPGFRWIDRLTEQISITPPKLSSRFKQLFGIVSIDPRASVYQLHELIEETFVLVETHLPDVDITSAREMFRKRRQKDEVS